MKKFLGIIGVVVMLCGACFGFKAFAASLTSGEVYELNNATPGTSKVGLGTRIESTFKADSETLLTGLNTISMDANQASVKYPVVIKWSNDAGVGSASPLLTGLTNQEFTGVMVVDGGGDWIITPQTKTGFTSVTFNDAGDTTTFKWVDSTIGWIIKAINGTTVTQ